MKSNTEKGLFIILIGMIIGIIATIIQAIYFLVQTSEPSGMYDLYRLPFIGSLGGLIVLIGEILFFIGRKEFGERHQKFVFYALLIIVIGVISITIVTSAITFFYVSSFMGQGSQEMINILSPSLFVSTIIGTVMSGLVYIFALYNLENESGRRILYIAFIVSVVITVGIYVLTVNELSELVKSYSTSTSYNEVTGSFQYLSLVSKYAVFGVISQALWAIAVYKPYKRIKDGELVPITTLSQGGLSTSDRICPNCRKGIPMDANICPYCGKQFDNYL